MQRWLKSRTWRAVASGSLTLGFVVAIDSVSLAAVFANFLLTLLSVLASLLLGGNPAAFFTNTGGMAGV